MAMSFPSPISELPLVSKEQDARSAQGQGQHSFWFSNCAIRFYFGDTAIPYRIAIELPSSKPTFHGAHQIQKNRTYGAFRHDTEASGFDA
ncbi:hypothetical protein K443DRAFT_4638 [Laccaria amethystina LaAM-08-1]|uniref:Uncharacterized protein n=1 Tax=Laccaria amethystina LaAM-08-1 TaxID=1095629 RepID=A0A0C9Y361_9AGAR|nr:hypothetical protein K443DRAFT_4638 [Laccaria amethystina LaAM-08-1]